MARFRAAIISDVHYGLDIKDKLGTKASRLMTAFMKAVRNYAPAMIIDLGDRISAVSPEEDEKHLKSYSEHFNDVATPLHGVIGNHDDKNMTRAEHTAMIGTPASSYSIDKDGYHLVFWSPNRYVTPDKGIFIDQESMDWLENDLAETDKPVLLFTHVPLDNIGDEGHCNIDKYFFWTEGEEIRKILEDSGKVLLCMTGHRHRDRHREINGIHYVTINSLVDTYREHYRVPRGTYAFLEVEGDQITIEIKGKTPRVYNLNKNEDKPSAEPATPKPA